MMTWLFEEYQRFADTHHGRSHPAPQARLAALAGLMRKAAGNEHITDALDEVAIMLRELETQLPGFRFIDPNAKMPEADPTLDQMLEPYRFR